MRTSIVALFRGVNRQSRRLHSLHPLLLALGLLTLLGPACQNEYVPALPAKLDDFYLRLRHDADHFPHHDGQWEQHNGDPPFYGTAFYVRAGTTQARPDYLTIATQSRDYALSVVKRASADRPYFVQNSRKS